MNEINRTQIQDLRGLMVSGNGYGKATKSMEK